MTCLCRGRKGLLDVLPEVWLEQQEPCVPDEAAGVLNAPGDPKAFELAQRLVQRIKDTAVFCHGAACELVALLSELSKPHGRDGEVAPDSRKKVL